MIDRLSKLQSSGVSAGLWLKRSAVMLLGWLLPVTLLGSHIFGGYLGLKQRDRNTGQFQLALTFYADLEEMSPQTQVDILSLKQYVSIYRRSDHRLMLTAVLSGAATRDLIYDNQACAKQLRLRTREYRYAVAVSLPPAEYTDAQGYYIVWDNCCRNGAVSNLRDPRQANILLYTTFPPLQQAGQPIAYSSPEFPILNGDYVCLNKTFSYNFSATDADGDQLRYRLVTPYQGRTNLYLFATPPEPGPYYPINWGAGYSLTSVIPGSLPLRIDEQSGKLSLRASQVGIYVFVVEVDEFRNGVQIGSVRHEFQLPVIDCNDQAIAPPVITLNGKPVNTLSLCPGQTLQLTTETTADWAFQWQKDEENIQEAIKNQLSVSAPGEYKVVKSLLKQCAADAASAVVTVSAVSVPAPLTISAASTSLCPGDVTALTAPASASLTYAWYHSGQLVGREASLTVTQGGRYELMATTKEGACKVPGDNIMLNAWPAPVLPGPGPLTLCAGESVNLEAPDHPQWTYNWTESGTLVGRHALVSVQHEGDYVLEIYDEHGCRQRSGPHQVRLGKNCAVNRLLIPNAFTPNQDGTNDSWEIKNIEQLTDCQVQVFNRWGETIFQSRGYKSPWDGTYQGLPVADSTYTYLIVVPTLSHEYRGTVTILR